MRLTVPPRSPSEVLGVSMCNFVRVKQVNRVPSEFLVIFTVTGFAAYVSIRQHTSAYVSMRTFGVLSDIHSHGVCELQVLQRQRSLNRLAHTSSYVSIRHHTSAYGVSIRQHTASAYVTKHAVTLKKKLSPLRANLLRDKTA